MGREGESPLLMGACRLEQLLLYALEKTTPLCTLSSSTRMYRASVSCTFRTDDWLQSRSRTTQSCCFRYEGILRTLGGFLSAGLVGDSRIVSGAGAARASVSPGFAALS